MAVAHSSDCSSPYGGLDVTPGKMTSTNLANSVNTSRVLSARSCAIESESGSTTMGNLACALARKPEDISLLEIYKAVGAPKAFLFMTIRFKRNMGKL
jgi:DNA-binding IscR family transcriptional regulator